MAGVAKTATRRGKVWAEATPVAKASEELFAHVHLFNPVSLQQPPQPTATASPTVR